MATGNRMVNPTSSVTYTAKATGPGGEATDTARVTVNVPPPSADAAPPPATAGRQQSGVSPKGSGRPFDYDKSDIRRSGIGLQANAAFFKEHPRFAFNRQ